MFASTRGDHTFMGVYDTSGKTVRFIAPSVDTDSDPIWSLDEALAATASWYQRFVKDRVVESRGQLAEYAAASATRSVAWAT